MTAPHPRSVIVASASALPAVSLVALVAANIVPVVGVLTLGWKVGDVMLVFWMENAVIGLYNIPRMLIAQKGGVANHLSKLFSVPFFIVHYGGFTLGHGFFIAVLFVLGTPINMGEPVPPFDGGNTLPLEDLGWILYDTLFDKGLIWAVLSLVVSHGISFLSNFIGREEFLHVSAEELIMRPYARVVVLHVAILVGGFLVMATGQPVAALLLLIALKLAIDIRAHLNERRRLAEMPAAA